MLLQCSQLHRALTLGVTRNTRRRRRLPPPALARTHTHAAVQLYVSGNKIVDRSTGKTVEMKGINYFGCVWFSPGARVRCGRLAHLAAPPTHTHAHNKNNNNTASTTGRRWSTACGRASRR